jgi:hypothetical protein
MGLMIIQRQTPFLKLNPVQILRRHTMLFHGNIIINLGLLTSPFISLSEGEGAAV